MNKLSSLLLICTSALALSTSAAFAGDNVVERSFDVGEGGTLYLKTERGSIDVRSHAADTVQVRVERSGEISNDFELEFTQDGDDVRVKGDQKGRSYWNQSRVRFIVMVPKTYNLEVKTSGGSIDLADLIGEVEAVTSGGSIDVGRITGNIDVKTSGGSIAVEEVAGNIRAHTSGGSIRARLNKQPTADCRLTTSGGSVTAYLAEDIAVDLQASTSGGRVSSDFDIVGTVKKNTIRGKINGGGPDLHLHTSGGSVRVKRL